MVSIEEAGQIIDALEIHTQTEVVALTGALGRVLGQDVTAPFPMPPFDKSAMDGFAYHSTDPSTRFAVVETIAAGHLPRTAITTGTCAKIMTGAMLPAGADRVARVEFTHLERDAMVIDTPEQAANICYRGEDMQPGMLALSAGSLIRAQEIAVLAALGTAQVTVFKQPQVGIYATGAELVEPGAALAAGQIYNSNAYAIAAQTIASGAVPHTLGVVADEPAALERAVREIAPMYPLVIFSGGVSAGDFDFVPATLKKLNYHIHFEKIAIQPGMPTLLASLDGRYAVGLPGNPVSTFVIFELFVKALLAKMLGLAWQPMTVDLPLKNGFSRKKTDRTSYFPVRIAAGIAEALDYHGSAHIHALSQANALGVIPAGQRAIEAGQTIHARLI